MHVKFQRLCHLAGTNDLTLPFRWYQLSLAKNHKCYVTNMKMVILYIVLRSTSITVLMDIYPDVLVEERFVGTRALCASAHQRYTQEGHGKESL